MNVVRCPRCDRNLIIEEVQEHQCREEVLDYKIKGNVLWLFDGVGWYPQKLTQNQPKVTPTRSTDNETESENETRFLTLNKNFQASTNRIQMSFQILVI